MVTTVEFATKRLSCSYGWRRKNPHLVQHLLRAGLASSCSSFFYNFLFAFFFLVFFYCFIFIFFYIYIFYLYLYIPFTSCSWVRYVNKLGDTQIRILRVSFVVLSVSFKMVTRHHQQQHHHCGCSDQKTRPLYFLLVLFCLFLFSSSKLLLIFFMLFLYLFIFFSTLVLNDVGAE